jgi:hypothetical protein
MTVRSSDRGGRRRPVNVPNAVEAPRDKTRITVDLAAPDYDALRDWAHFARMSHSDVLRTLVRLLAADESVATAVRESGTQGRPP